MEEKIQTQGEESKPNESTEGTKEEEKTKPTNESEAGSSAPAELPILNRAVDAAERLEAANKQTEKLLDRQEQLMANQVLGGQSFAGLREEKKPLTPLEKAEGVMNGTFNPFE